MKISINKKEESKEKWLFEVSIQESESKTTHEVTIQKKYYEKLKKSNDTPEKLLHRSFNFLLQREPKETILASFDLPIIQKYFPEYESTI